ncbi:conserved hypothetical protein [Talaromyces stipitatus ATCC 10500]|uniref:NmrA-like domain-containing protein n=1 Tax=Talaromyces stipitatus (strain ATCC 10500 / CBS 375.48 / QM 6759 / NRRL 1006) TaxID=441959 RepID=B8MRG9_TALSN|nr:uncharacterized protein TSTA_056060 [Talaromyces stipitatus ATCC 10500]EED13106.1 conserved hypothetical protein [Talaromyces stipitatus ATCC 10500]
MAPQKILIIGAGELGFQVLRSLATHPRKPSTIAVLLRPSSIDRTSANTSKQKQEQNDALRSMGVQFVPGDIVEDSEQTLSSIFVEYDTVIGCTGFVSGRSVQTKITQAVIAAGTPRYIPWQFGVDYDAIGRGSAQDVFDEQLDVRDLLRAPGQTKTRWTIVSTGMFTSFLFEPSFGVVDKDNATINALGSLENSVTVTTPEDIGALTAEIVMRDLFDNQPIFVGGDTVTYERLAQLVEKVTRKTFRRNVLTVENMLATLAGDPGNGLLKYQVVFGQGRGVAWDLAATWNMEHGIRTETVEDQRCYFLDVT